MHQEKSTGYAPEVELDRAQLRKSDSDFAALLKERDQAIAERDKAFHLFREHAEAADRKLERLRGATVVPESAEGQTGIKFLEWLLAEARWERDEALRSEVKAHAEVERLRERAAKLEALLLDVLNVLPPELGEKIEARMPALAADTEEEESGCVAPLSAERESVKCRHPARDRELGSPLSDTEAEIHVEEGRIRWRDLLRHPFGGKW